MTSESPVPAATRSASGAAADAPSSTLGFIAIGRNEGERLVRCLSALTRESARVVYVDSGSTDDSVAAARRLGALVVELDSATPFTAARARNAGYAALTARWPEGGHVMFIDGDCALAPRFPQLAAALLDAEPQLGIVAGRVREIAPERSVYNRLCDLEWATAEGDVDAVGGIFMIRRAAFERVGGFNASVIAAEDDELCIRVRAAGYRIRRVPEEMCRHDAAMTSFGQWWRRAFRAGHAYAQLGELHGTYFASARRRAWLWGLALPLAALLAAPWTYGLSLAGAALLYAASFVRIRARLAGTGAAARDATAGAFFLVLSKFPNLLGIISFALKRRAQRRVAIVEYK